jgi:hypothetical protein
VSERHGDTQNVELADTTLYVGSRYGRGAGPRSLKRSGRRRVFVRPFPALTQGNFLGEPPRPRRSRGDLGCRAGSAQTNANPEQSTRRWPNSVRVAAERETGVTARGYHWCNLELLAFDVTASHLIIREVPAPRQQRVHRPTPPTVSSRDDADVSVAGPIERTSEPGDVDMMRLWSRKCSQRCA